MDKFYQLVESNRDYYIKSLSEAVAIQSVSSDPSRRDDTIRMMSFAAEHLQRVGATDITLHPNPAGLQKQADGSTLPLPPILTACYGKDPSKRTICVYGHLDVQPASKSDGWETDPFVLTEKDGKLYGRGSTDDKGPVLSWIHLIDGYKTLGKELPVNLKFLLEGMEESGSEGLELFCQQQSKAKGGFLDNVFASCISDNYFLGSTKPCVTYGLRGICYFTLEVRCSSKDLHSGVYGGPVREAMVDLVHILGTLNNSDGSIAVQGILDAVRPVTEAEEKSYETIDFNPEEFKKEINAKALRFDTKAEVLKSRWRNPTLSVHGIEGAWSGVGAKTVIPARTVGKFSLRIVPDMEPIEVEKLIAEHVEREWIKLKSPNEYKLESIHGAKAWLSPFDSPNYAAARSAVKKVYGTEPDLTREGGSIPFTLWLQDATESSVLLLPIGACDDSAHSTNEKFNISNMLYGVKVLATYLEEVATV